MCPLEDSFWHHKIFQAPSVFFLPWNLILGAFVLFYWRMLFRNQYLKTKLAVTEFHYFYCVCQFTELGNISMLIHTYIHSYTFFSISFYLSFCMSVIMPSFWYLDYNSAPQDSFSSSPFLIFTSFSYLRNLSLIIYNILIDLILVYTCSSPKIANPYLCDHIIFHLN